jgi:sigma-E factor negative regulatory protein RseC
MIEIAARVVRVEGDTAWVTSQAPTSCGACGGKGCGSSVFARLVHGQEADYPVANLIEARAGDPVVVGIPDGALFQATLAGYLVPLALLILGALLGSRQGDAGAVLGAMLGMMAAYFWLRRQRAGARPEILRLGATHCETRN